MRYPQGIRQVLKKLPALEEAARLTLIGLLIVGVLCLHARSTEPSPLATKLLPLALALVLFAAIYLLLERPRRREIYAIRLALEAIRAGRASNIRVPPAIKQPLDELARHLIELASARDEAREDRAVLERGLNALESMVRVADYDGKVLFANKALLSFLRAGEAHIQKVNPHFRVDAFVGGSIGALYPDPQAAVKRMQQLKEASRVRAPNNNMFLDLIYHPIFDSDGKQIGTISEWFDVTSQVHTEDALLRMITFSADGDFAHRMTTDALAGSHLAMAKGINQLLSITETSLKQVTGLMGALAAGDLTGSIEGDPKGLFRDLRDDMNAMTAQLAITVRQIKQTAMEVNVAAAEISEGMANLGARTEQQAANIEETAASMVEMTQAVTRNAEGANSANKVAVHTGEIAVRGRGAVNDVSATIATLKASSSSMKDIVGVIEALAFSTNILAINARIEAANAGEYGVGFAVVATEIRNLALRCSDAAKRIGGMINESLANIDSASTQVESAGRTMTQIDESVAQVCRSMDQIAGSCNEQRRGIEQVNRAIADMDSAIQQNAALVEEASAATRSLKDLSDGLVGSVAVFRVQP